MKLSTLGLVLWVVCAPLFAAPPPNDLCSGAHVLTGGVTYNMSTVEATTTNDAVAPCNTSAGNGVWFAFIPLVSGAVTVTTCGSSYDTLLSVFTGGCDGLTPVPDACVDDSAQCGLQSQLSFTGSAGTVYYILAAGYSWATGSLSVRAETVGVKITQQPAGSTVTAGDTYTFSVQAVGSPAPTYQWRQNGAAIAGATRSWLTRANVNPGFQGAYTAVVSSGSMSETSTVASLTVTSGLQQALDAAGLTWTTGGSTDGWYRQTDFWLDGIDSARCGAPTGPTGPWMETVISGAATLSFWWRLPVAANNTDHISVTVNGQEQTKLFSLVDGWFQSVVYLGSGSKTCRWTYVRGASPSSNVGYVDQVGIAYGGTAPQITLNPISVSRVAGTNASFEVSAIGTPPFSYQWYYKGAEISDATARILTLQGVLPRNAGLYYALVQNGYGQPAQSSSALLDVSTVPLSLAADYRGLPLMSSPASSPWFGQVGTTIDGAEALRSGEIANNQSSTLQFEAQGPANISFWWKVSCETNYDALRFYIDSFQQAQVTGENNWQYRSFVIPPGKHLVTWSYEKDASLSQGQDAAWVDQIIYDGAPYLTTERGSGGTCVISWPGSLTGFQAQRTASLTSPSWVNVGASPIIRNEEWVITNQPTQLRQYYRLIK